MTLLNLSATAANPSTDLSSVDDIDSSSSLDIQDTSDLVAIAYLAKVPIIMTKNTIVQGNNIAVTKSVLRFFASDRAILKTKVEDLVIGDNIEMTPTLSDPIVLAKEMMKVVSAPNTDILLFGKANAVIAAKDNISDLKAKVVDFVDTAGEHEAAIEDEEAIPQGVVIRIGTKDLLRDSIDTINKNLVMDDDNQLMFTKTRLSAVSRDKVNLRVSGTLVTKMVDTASKEVTKDDYRMSFRYSKTGSTITGDTDNEFHYGLGGYGLGGYSGFGLGWRYPLSYWNLYGNSLYGRVTCGYGHIFGGYYYC